MSSDTQPPVLSFQEAGKTYPPQRTPLRQLWGHLRGSQRLEAGGYTALQPTSFDVLRALNELPEGV